jgi:hypothetical protein
MFVAISRGGIDRGMPPIKHSPRAERQPRAADLRELFQCHAIPPTPLHEAIQEAARQEGWTPPWNHEAQRAQKAAAGERSGVSRRGRADIRLSIIGLARMRISPEHRREPYSKAAIAALRREYDNLMSKSADDPDPLISGMLSALSPTDRKHLKNASDETLIADVKIIRRRRGVKR